MTKADGMRRESDEGLARILTDTNVAVYETITGRTVSWREYDTAYATMLDYLKTELPDT